MPSQDEAVAVEQPGAPAPAAPAAARRVRGYDFRRPQHLAGDQVRAVQRVHAAAAEALQDILSRALGLNLRVSVDHVEELAFGLLQEALSEHTYTTVLDLAPLNDRGVLYLDAPMCLLFVDRVLGGHALTMPASRALTAIDQAALDGVLELLLNCLREAWKDLCPLKMAVEERRTEPDQVQLWVASEPVLAVTLKLAGSQGEGALRLCIPVARLKGRANGSAARPGGRGDADRGGESRQRLLRLVERVSLTMTASLGKVEVPLRHLNALRVGDVIRMDHPSDYPIVLDVEGRPRFMVKMGLRGRRKAVQVVERMDRYFEE